MSQATIKNVGNLDMLILKTAFLRYPLFKSVFNAPGDAREWSNPPIWVFELNHYSQLSARLQFLNDWAKKAQEKIPGRGCHEIKTNDFYQSLFRNDLGFCFSKLLRDGFRAEY